MFIDHCPRGKFSAALCAFSLVAAASLPAMAEDQMLADTSVVLDEVTVTGTREEQKKSETPATVDMISGEELRDIKASHPGEVMSRIPGVHVNVTNGEGHMAAIRQPITTGSVYLYLEDGIPTRATGFFNHNALYEVNLPQANGVEVTKGPGSALQGSDAIGGVINVVTRAPSNEFEAEGSAEYGSNGWLRGLASVSNTWGNDAIRIDANYTRTDGWRQATEYDRQSGTVRWDRSFNDGAYLKTVLAVSNINQQTAGTTRLRRDDYYDNATANYYPISIRNVRAVRLSSAYEREDGPGLLSITPYMRWNDMELLPNWQLTYDPTIYHSGHSSLGLMAKYRHDFEKWRTRLVSGADFDYSPGWHHENEITAPRTNGRYYRSYTLGEEIYNYDAVYMSASPYIHLETSPIDRLRLSAGGRFDLMRYEYENNLSEVTTGSHRKAASNTTNYMHFSPKLGATYAVSPGVSVFGTYNHAFRAPSANTLFRSGSAADTLHLDPVKVDNYEVGLRGRNLGGLSYEVSLYYMEKQDDILSYDDGTTTVKTNAGETLHRGIEVGVGVPLGERFHLDTSYSYAKHTYEEWKPDNSTDYSGNEMSSAPRTIANATLAYRPKVLPGSAFELEWTHLGKYFMDEANEHTYKGHHLFNLRGSYDINDRVKIYGRVNNLFDKRYAMSASYNSFRGEELAPGMPLTAYFGIEGKF